MAQLVEQQKSLTSSKSGVSIQDEKSVIVIQSIGRRKLAQRKAALQKELIDEKKAEENKFRQQPIEMPVDELEIAEASSKQDLQQDANSLRHPVHPFNKADPHKFEVVGQDKVAGGMQRVYRRMLQSKNWW
jgi:hypothetical protein